MGEHIAGQERQLREAKARFVAEDELAMQTEHLFGGQRRLLNRPANSVDQIEVLRRQGDVSDESHRFFVVRIVEDKERNGGIACIHFGRGGHSVVPSFIANGAVLITASAHRLGRRGRNSPVQRQAILAAGELCHHYDAINTPSLKILDYAQLALGVVARCADKDAVSSTWF